MRGPETLDGLLAVGGQADPSPFQGQDPLHQVAVHGAVVHRQDMEAGQAGPGWHFTGRYGRRRRLQDRGGGEGQFKAEGAALALGARDLDRPSHQRHQALADRQAQPGATEAAGDAGIGLGEGLKQTGEGGRAHADAGVPHLKAQAPAGGRGGGEGHSGGWRGCVGRNSLGRGGGVLSGGVLSGVCLGGGVLSGVWLGGGVLGDGGLSDGVLGGGGRKVGRRGSKGRIQSGDGEADLAIGGELDGVAEEVDQDLLQAQGVALHGTQGHRRWADAQGQALGAGGGRQQAVHSLEEGRRIEGPGLQAQLAGLDLGEVEDIVDDPQQGLAGGLDALDHGGLVVAQAFATQQLGQAEDGVHGGADLVAHVGQEFALGPGGGLGGLLGEPQLRLQSDALANVVDHAQMTGALTGLQGQGGDGHADPDHAAVRLQVALIHLEAGDLPGVEARHVVQVGLHVVRMSEAHPVAGQHLLARASGDGGEAVVDGLDPAGQGVDQGDAQGGLGEHGAEPFLGPAHLEQGLPHLRLGGLQLGGPLGHLPLQGGIEGADLLLQGAPLADVR